MNSTQMTLRAGQIEAGIENRERGRREGQTEKERVKGHGHVCPNGQGLQSRSVT